MKQGFLQSGNPLVSKLGETFKRTSQEESATYSIDDFEINRHIGDGNFCAVYAVTLKRTSEQLCLKIFERSKIERMHKINDVIMERHIMLRLTDGYKNAICSDHMHHEDFTHHPNIVRFVSTFKNATHVYFLYELLDRGSLCDKLLGSGSLDELTAQYYIVSFLHAVKYIHSLNILHRDLKAENIMIDEQHNMKLIDFGTAVDFNWKSIAPSCLVSSGRLRHLSSLQSKSLRASEKSVMLPMGTAELEKVSHQFITSDVILHEGDATVDEIIAYKQQYIGNYGKKCSEECEKNCERKCIENCGADCAENYDENCEKKCGKKSGGNFEKKCVENCDADCAENYDENFTENSTKNCERKCDKNLNKNFDSAAARIGRSCIYLHHVGTPNFMPPECIENKASPGFSRDLFSIGCTIYQIIHGIPPFDGSTNFYVFENVKHGRLHYAHDVSEQCVDLIESLIDPNPCKRLGFIPFYSDYLRDGSLQYVRRSSDFNFGEGIDKILRHAFFIPFFYKFYKVPHKTVACSACTATMLRKVDKERLQRITQAVYELLCTKLLQLIEDRRNALDTLKEDSRMHNVAGHFESQHKYSENVSNVDSIDVSNVDSINVNNVDSINVSNVQSINISNVQSMNVSTVHSTNVTTVHSANESTIHSTNNVSSVDSTDENVSDAHSTNENVHNVESANVYNVRGEQEVISLASRRQTYTHPYCASYEATSVQYFHECTAQLGRRKQQVVQFEEVHCPEACRAVAIFRDLFQRHWFSIYCVDEGDFSFLTKADSQSHQCADGCGYAHSCIASHVCPYLQLIYTKIWTKICQKTLQMYKEFIIASKYVQ